MLRLICANLLAVLLSSSASASIFDRDDRVLLSKNSASLLPVGIVSRQSILGAYATGFLISGCHVLTVRHFIRSTRVVGTAVKFKIIHRGKTLQTKGYVVTAGDFQESEVGRHVGQNRSQDWALVRLSDCLGETVGYMKLARTKHQQQRELALAGFPIDRSRKVITIDPECRIRAGLGRQVLHDCATREGNSGSPIIEVQTKTVVAMHTAGVPTRGVQPFNILQAGIAAPIDEIIPSIERIISLNQ